MTFTSAAQYQDAGGQWMAYRHAAAELWLQPGCLGREAVVSRATGDADGNLTFTHVSGYLARGVPAAGCWRVSVPQTTVYLASQSESVRVTVSVPTWLNGVRLRRAGRYAHLTGTLDDDHRAGPLADKTVGVYRETGRSWRRVATARTRSDGSFSFRLTGRRRGHYRVRYAGGTLPGGKAAGSYLPVSSRRVWFSG